MLQDFNNLSDGQVLDAEVCIIGAGAAGITLALELAGSGLDVLVLESGGPEEEPDTQALYEGSVEDEQMHSPPDRYRQRRFGGTTTIWGGRCMPFDPIDFEPRDFIADSGWPIDGQALARYYPTANRLCEAGDFVYSAAEALHPPLRPMLEGFHSSHFSTDTLERFSCPTDFGYRYGQRLARAANVRVLFHANVSSIELAPDGQQVRAVKIQNLRNIGARVTAKQFVLATGGLEVARLLLASRNVSPQGVGNRYDVVGRYYMCHLAGTIGKISVPGGPERAFHGYDVADDGIYCRRRIALLPQTQREQRLINFIARLHHPRITDPIHRSSVLSLIYLAKPFISYEYGKRLHGGDKTSATTWMKHARNVITDPWSAIGFAWHMLRDRKLAERKFPSIIVRAKSNLFSLDFHAEQIPNRNSRVTLGNENDALGMPRIHIDWRYTSEDVSSVQRTLKLLADDIQSSGIGTFEYDEAEVELEMTRYGAYGGHHIGTARMGTDPRTSVTNADCRLHDVENLYVAGSAVFPTSSQANPTLTVVAMALRLADHLKSRSRQFAAPAEVS